MSNVMLEGLRQKVKKLEEYMKLDGATMPEWQREGNEAALKHAKKRLEILEKSNLEQTTNDMRAILSHTKSVEEKYECRSVKSMFWLARFVSYFSKPLGQKIQDYAVKEIHAPVCSIVAGTKPELPPMPVHVSTAEDERAKHRAREMEELKRFQQLTSDWMQYKPSRWELIKHKYVQVKIALRSEPGPVLSEQERMEQKAKAVMKTRIDLTQKGNTKV